jgi:DUF971 family protein
MTRMDPRTTPVKLDLKRDEKLEIRWQDGHASTYPIALLRKHCPCAECKEFRAAQVTKPRTSLTVFSKSTDKPLAATGAQLVGGYALRIDWSDGHTSGIYSWEYLRGLEGGGSRQ